MFVASTHKKSHVMIANKSRCNLFVLTQSLFFRVIYVCFLFSHRPFLSVIYGLSVQLIIIAHLATTKEAILTIGADYNV